MALECRVVKRRMTVGPDKGKEKDVVVTRSSQVSDLSYISRLISSSCSLSASDVIAAVEAIKWVLITELQKGNIVKLGDLGSFRLSVREGPDKKTDFSRTRAFKTKILFSPGKGLHLPDGKVTIRQVKKRQ